ncbi:hypothetical protein AAFF_G00369610 [Aldrovandia affinis]|uniref:Chemokine interleukin-8-like domain-containing protein n=1 Tax=Aldrovandia affinis TaxID=143900 RepID=A0AAD7R4Z9_9TELE|nr:hypothetical protein AAFF_G00369610 [Aldrovandia affinis]
MGVAASALNSLRCQLRSKTRLQKSQQRVENGEPASTLQDSTFRIPDMRLTFSGLTLLLILACVYLTLAQGSYEDCCLKYVKNVPKKMRHMVSTYRRQETDGGCNIPAIIFTLRRGRMFCADPSQLWAQVLIKKVDNRKHAKRAKSRG